MGTLNTRLTLVWIGLSLLAVPRAWAVDPSQQTSAQQVNPVLTNPAMRAQAFPWTDESQNHVCDQACMLTKGNENLSLQALYLVERMQGLQSKYAAAVQASNTQAYEEIVSSLWNFCGDKTPKGASQDDARGCLRRYVQAKSLDLQSIKAAIVQNRTAELSYRSRATTPILTSAGEPPSAKFPQYARAPTQEELSKQFLEEQKQLQYLGSDPYARWAAALPREPQLNDYCKTHFIPDPEGSKKPVQVADVGVDGKCAVFDRPRYEADQQEFRALKFGRDAIPTTPKGGQAEFESGKKAAAGVSFDAYKEARNKFTEKSNQTLVTGTAELTFPGPGAQRNTAATSPMVNGNVIAAVPLKTTAGDLHTTRYLPEEIEKFMATIDTHPQGNGSVPLDTFLDYGTH